MFTSCRRNADHMERRSLRWMTMITTRGDYAVFR
jgi:hypothetical protein